MLWPTILVQDSNLNQRKRKEAGNESSAPPILKKGSCDVCGTHHTEAIPVEDARMYLCVVTWR
jgi:hypothetical protein